MHFNELIARFRIQALGGTATVGTVAAVVLNKSADATAVHAIDPSWVFTGLLAFLAVAWTALWQLDYYYYHRLLGGAVKAILKLEARIPELTLSTDIEGNFPWRIHGHFWFYSLIQAILLLMFWGAAWRIWDPSWLFPFWAASLVMVAWLVLLVVKALPRKR